MFFQTGCVAGGVLSVCSAACTALCLHRCWSSLCTAACTNFPSAGLLPLIPRPCVVELEGIIRAKSSGSTSCRESGTGRAACTFVDVSARDAHLMSEFSEEAGGTAGIRFPIGTRSRSDIDNRLTTFDKSTSWPAEPHARSRQTFHANERCALATFSLSKRERLQHAITAERMSRVRLFCAVSF